MNRQLLVTAVMLVPLVGVFSSANAAMNHQGQGGWRTSDGRGGWVQNDDAENRFDIGIDACKQACEDNDRCWGIEYVSDPNGWEEAGLWVHNKCEIHRDPYAHCDQSGGGRGSADDGCWIKQAPVLVGCVRDGQTGLLWQLKNDDATSPHWKDKSYLWDAVPGYVATVNAENLCGRNNWRLPTLTELESIVDYGRRNPAIDTGRFGPTATLFHWSSSAVQTGTSEQVFLGGQPLLINGEPYFSQLHFSNDFIAGVGFADGYSGATPKTSQIVKAVRLVSDGR